jgi:hypothetical protein
MPPKLNRKRALFVLTKIDEILAWEKQKESERDTRFVDLGRYLCEVRAGQYWRLENLKSFDEFLTRRGPRISQESVLPDVDPRALAAAGAEGPEGSGMDEGPGIGKNRTPGRSGLRLCNLVAQSSRTAEGGLQACSGEGTDGKGRGTVAVDLLQGLHEPDFGDRAGDRDGSPDARGH